MINSTDARRQNLYPCNEAASEAAQPHLQLKKKRTSSLTFWHRGTLQSPNSRKMTILSVLRLRATCFTVTRRQTRMFTGSRVKGHGGRLKNSRENFEVTRHLSFAYPPPFQEILSRISEHGEPTPVDTRLSLRSLKAPKQQASTTPTLCHNGKRPRKCWPNQKLIVPLHEIHKKKTAWEYTSIKETSGSNRLLTANT